MPEASSNDILANLTIPEREALCSVGHEKKFAPNEYLIREGEKRRSMLFVLAGEAIVSRHDRSGKEVIITTIKKGSCLGELSLLLGEPRSADVIARSDVTALEISHRAYLNHKKKFKGLSDQLTMLVARRLRDTTQKLADLAFLDVPSRVLSVLKSLSKYYSVDGEQELRCIVPKQHDLAAMVGSSREMVNRALTLLEECGEIERFEGYAILTTK